MYVGEITLARQPSTFSSRHNLHLVFNLLATCTMGSHKNKAKHRRNKTKARERTKKDRRRETGIATGNSITPQAPRPMPVERFMQFVQVQRKKINDDEARQLIDMARQPCLVEYQPEVIGVAVRHFCGKTPRPLQVRVIRRLVFGYRDTILVAKTGFGKSLLYQTYSMLTGKIAIQLAPLNKLSEEQVQTLCGFGVSSVAVTADTKFENPGLLREIRRGDYRHIVMGPEQAASDEMRDIFRDAQFSPRVGLIIIDECHVVSDWKDFRASVQEILLMRNMLPPTVNMFGCTATMSAEQEVDIRTFGGFRNEGSNYGELEIMRFSVDRPEISIIIRTFDRGSQQNPRQLKFLLHGAMGPCTDAPFDFNADFGQMTTDDKWIPTPQRIPKAIIFIDSKTKINEVARMIFEWLQDLGYSRGEAVGSVKTYSS